MFQSKKVGTFKLTITYGLRNMIKALSIMEILNTEEENQRLALAKAEIKRRRASS